MRGLPLLLPSRSELVWSALALRISCLNESIIYTMVQSYLSDLASTTALRGWQIMSGTFEKRRMQPVVIPTIVHKH